MQLGMCPGLLLSVWPTLQAKRCERIRGSLASGDLRGIVRASFAQVREPHPGSKEGPMSFHEPRDF